MGLIELVLTIAVVGFITWLVTTKIPMADYIRISIHVLVILVILFIIMRAFGIGDIPLPRVR